MNRRRWRGPPRPLLLAVLASILVGVVHLGVVATPNASVSSDDGAYVLAGRALGEGRWDVPFVAGEVDEAGYTYPYRGGSDGGKHYPYVRRPLWVAAIAVGDAVGGVWGMHGVVLAFAAAGIALIGRLGSEVGGRRVGTLAAVFGLLSPLTYHALQLWAHAATVPLLAVVYLCAARWLSGVRSVGLAVGGAVSAALAVAMHASALPFAAAVALVVGVRGLTRRSLSLMVLGGVTGVGALGGHAASALVANRISAGSALPGTRTGSGNEGRLDGLLDTLATNPSFNGSEVAKLLALTALIALAAGVVASRTSRGPLATRLLVVAACLWLVRILVDPDAMATGLLVGWPIVLLIGLRPWSIWSSVERDLLAMAGLAIVVVLATQYDFGGGLNWGGRFLLGALPVLVVLAAAGLDHLSDEPAGAGRPAALAAMAVAAMVVFASLRADAVLRARHDQVSIAALRASTDIVVTSNELIPRRSWRTADHVDWLVVASPENGGIERTEKILREMGVDRFTGLFLSASDYRHWTGLDPRTQPREGVVIELVP